MKFSIHDSISIAGNKTNEDIVYATDNYGWVIDGATGLNNKNFTGSLSDAYWFVNEWNNYLKENISDNSTGIKEIIIKGIECISNKFYHIVKLKHIDRTDLPSASIVVIRINNKKVEYFLLGDCTLIVQNNNGKSLSIKQNLLDILDGKVKTEMAKLMVDKGMKYIEARQEINSLLVKHRLLKNTPNGYWTLEFDKNAVENSLCGCFDFVECKKILLMSDGFSVIFDNYNYVDKNNIISIVEKQGLEQIYNVIRFIEEEDADILKFPRFKKSDDASAIIFSE
ncbi:hypothetical protein [Clostridium sp.]|uniref:hypothetical protein n=1 Tax=Clostridium sp. TaxID=1506 RepID=UPI001A39B18F|nr:hypothetical protein [Clostridium sp.]MBK5241699.1 hypothetical protein [Clostridium sp.]